METLVAYLKEKVRTSKRHIACNHLKRYDGDLTRFMIYAADTIVGQFQRTEMERSKGLASARGEANLTRTSVAIGEYVLEQIGIDRTENDAPWDWFRQRIMMGNLFIECFYQHGWIDIGKMYSIDKTSNFYPYEKLTYNQKKSQAPYILVPQEWPEDIQYAERDKLFGISLTPPLPITDILQPTGRPVIKGWTKADSIKFQQYQYRDWVQAMNVLQQTPWRVNREVHEILKRNKDNLLDLHKKLPKKYASKVIEFDRTMSKAEALLNKTFHYYMECDYRGRLYYTMPFLNFQSNDIARGQLLFEEKKEMTDEGLYWLAAHTACSYNQTYSIDELPEWTTTDYRPHLESEELQDISVDKMTIEDRVQWTMQNMSWILEQWDNQSICLEAEKPIAFLSCCQEWSLVWEAHDKGEPHYTNLPIPVDGSNNGWQHLSAMSKDKQAGELVGVVPQEIQKDFYVQTAKELLQLMPEWFSERQMPMKHIRKGIAKRGSMTRAYSAGALKIAENMYLDCHVEGYDTKYNITEEDCIELAKNLVKAIDKVCAGPLQTMKFLQKIAEAEIASDWAVQVGRKAIEWTTPSGFPVKYEAFSEYEFGEKSTISCSMREEQPVNTKTGEVYTTIRLELAGKESTDKPKIRSFMSGISPNFVHSMDATHMSMVIKEWGGSFGPVHDSFSVHACDIPDLLDLIKEQFIKIYDYPNFFEEIERMVLSEPLEFNYPQPELGDLEIREVLNSDYFFA